MRTLPLLVLATISLSLALGGAVLLERRETLHRPQHQEIVYLPPPWLARSASLGYGTLVADYYWLQALQYYGNPNHRRVNFQDLHRYIELVIGLDPDFEYAYYFGGTAVPYNQGNWQWRNVEEARRILERGVARFPQSARLWLQLGYTHSVLRDDPAAAAEAYRRAAATDAAPLWINSLVTRLEAASGQIDRARAYAQEILRRTDDAHLREAMERRLVELDVEEVLQGIDRAREQYEQMHGMPPAELESLVTEGLLDRIPPCPLGGAFAIGPDGIAYSTALQGGRLRAFEPAARRAAREMQP